MIRRIAILVIGLVLLVALNYSVKVTQGYHFPDPDSLIDWPRPEPSEAVQYLCGLAGYIQPWWSVAVMFDPWDSPRDGRWPIRFWMGSSSFPIIGSVVSVIFYLGLFVLFSRIRYAVRKRNAEQGEALNP